MDQQQLKRVGGLQTAPGVHRVPFYPVGKVGLKRHSYKDSK